MTFELAIERRRHDGAGGDAEPQLGKAQVRFAARRLQQIVEHGRHAGEVGERAALEQPHRFAGREPLHDVARRAGGEDAEHRQVQRVGMKQRQRGEHRVALGKTGDRRPAGGDDPQHAVDRELHAFGAAGGARSVENERGLVQRRGIARRGFRLCHHQRFVAECLSVALAAIGHNQCFQTGCGRLQPCEEIAALGGRDHGFAVGVGEPIGDFRFGGIVGDRHADGAGAGDGETAFHPLHRIRQHNRDGVAPGDAVVGEMAGELAGALQETGVSHGRLRVAKGDLVAVRGGVPVQQFRDRCDQTGVQHRLPQTML